MSSSITADAMLGATTATIADANEFRHAASINALTKIYGPTAYDPAAALQMQQVQQSKATTDRTNTLTPLEADQMGIANAHSRAMNPTLESQAQETLRHSQAANPILEQQGAEDLRHAQTSNPLSEQQQQTQNAQSNENLRHSQVNNPEVEAQSKQATEAGDIALQDTKTRRTQGGLMAMGALLPEMNKALQQGKDPNAVFDAGVAQIAQITGTDPKHYEPYRQQFLADPQGAMARIQDEIKKAQFYTMTPADQAKVQVAQVDIANKQADTQNKQQELEKKTRENAQAVAGQQLAADSAETMFDQSETNIKHALELNKKAGRISELASKFPGIAAYVAPEANDFNATLNSVHSDIVNNVINKFKQTSAQGQASGVGRVLQAEVKLWQDAYAAVESSQSPPERERQLNRLLTVTQQLRKDSNAYFEKQGISTSKKSADSSGGSGGGTGVLTDQDKQAIEWANANQNDPLAQQIKTKLRKKMGID